ncbi:hypothetical protein, partial [Paratractidigestivibacter faecalis]|uniref:hypothetical protein n=1 Tax=Paratractidigestivibacter faecalis TaxID=2292441 RepID=UPI003AF92536
MLLGAQVSPPLEGNFEQTHRKPPRAQIRPPTEGSFAQIPRHTPLKLGTCSLLRKFEHVPNLRAFFFGRSATMKKKEMAYFFFFGGYT